MLQTLRPLASDRDRGGHPPPPPTPPCIRVRTRRFSNRDPRGPELRKPFRSPEVSSAAVKSMKCRNRPRLQLRLLKLLPELFKLTLQVFDFLFQFCNAVRLLLWRFRILHCPDFTGQCVGVSHFFLPGLPQ